MHPRLSVNLAGSGEPFGDDFGMTLEQKLDAVVEYGYAWFGMLNNQLGNDEDEWSRSSALISFHPARLAYLIHLNFFTLENRSAWEAERESLIRTVEAASSMGAQYVYGTSGPAGKLSFEEANAALAAAVEPLFARCRELGVDLLIETTNQLKQELNYATTLRDLAVLGEVTGLGLCPDLFQNWREPNLEEVARTVAPRSGMVQLSDWVPGTWSLPGRVVPGDGAIPLERVIAAFEQAGYSGFYDVEVLGPRLVEEGFGAYRRAGEYLTGILEAVGAQA